MLFIGKHSFFAGENIVHPQLGTVYDRGRHQESLHERGWSRESEETEGLRICSLFNQRTGRENKGRLKW